MNPERHALEVELFEAACDLPPEERAAFLDERCGDDAELRQRLGVLFEADSLPLDELAQPALDLHELVDPDPPAMALPNKIADFDIVRELGRGGMGIVYEAEQDHPRRRVALKVVRSHWMTPSTLRRFEHEAEVLGWLNHAGIAQVYEAGTWHDGERDVPYFAMELVRGIPLVRWADEEDLGLQERLKLFVRVCEAVHHAHTKGVIHRDLKPSNILVDEHGQPKVLDFGVARVMQSELSMTTMHTRSGELVGTLKYMSPEQVGSDGTDLDTRSDVYALGVVAYELLIGRAPYDLAGKVVHEAARVIIEKEPSSLGAFDPRLKGDVETIVQKAVSKERERRYASAEELASDVRRYLADEPIVARPPSRLYQLKKFARRNRTLVGGIVAVFFALCAGLIVAVGLYRETEVARVEAVRATLREREQLVRAEAAEAEARREAERAQLEARTADRVAHFLIELFEQADSTRQGGRELTAVGLLDTGAQSIRASLAHEPRLRGRVLRVMGRAYEGLGMTERALELLEEGIEIGRTQSVVDGDFATDLSLFGRLLQFQGDFERAESVLLEAVEASAQDDQLRAARVRIDLAALVADTGRQLEAERMQREALLFLEERLGPEHQDLVFALREYAATLHALGRHAEATPLQERAVAIVREASPARADELVLSLSDLGWGWMYAFRPERALVFFEEALELGEATYEDDHPTLALQRYNLASALTDLERHDEAEALFRAALEFWLASAGAEHQATAAVMDGYAELLQRTGRIDEALEMRARVRAADLAHFGPSHPRIATNAARSGKLALERGDVDLALAEFERALEVTAIAWGTETVQYACALSELADALVGVKRMTEACERYAQSTAVWASLDLIDPDRAYALEQLAWCHVEGGDFPAAEPLMLEAWELWVAVGWSTEELADPRRSLADFYERWGRPEEAQRWLPERED